MPPDLEPCYDAYRELLAVARRFARSDADARDLAQDAVAIALSRGFMDWSTPSRRAWLFGVVRKRAAFIIRGQKRRLQREQHFELSNEAGVSRWSFRKDFLSSLPRSLRVVAVLVSADLSAREIRWLLSLSDTAFRQRLTALRRAVSAQAETPTQTEPVPASSFGGPRAILLASLKRHPGRVVATHDPDGHAILLRMSPHKAGAVGNE